MSISQRIVLIKIEIQTCVSEKNHVTAVFFSLHLMFFSLSERDYYDLCVSQPIGKKLFHLYCMTRPELHNHMSFLEALVC